MAWSMGKGLRDCPETPAASLSLGATGLNHQDTQTQSDFLFLSSAGRPFHEVAHKHDCSTLASQVNTKQQYPDRLFCGVTARAGIKPAAQPSANCTTKLSSGISRVHSHLLLLVASDAGVRIMTPVVTGYGGLPAHPRGTD